jgi:YidC/Oxa1 family membrane protein insertase
MEKKTIIAVVLAVAVIIVGMLIQSVFFPPGSRAPEQAQGTQQQAPEPAPPQAAEPTAQQAAEPQAGGQTAPQVGEVSPAQPLAPGQVVTEGQAKQGELREETITVETNVFIAEFSNRGGELTSLKLKEFTNPDGSLVDMVFSQDSGVYPFTLRFGDYNAPPVDVLFNYEESLTGPGVTFFQTFRASNGIPFVLRKSFSFRPNSYMVEVRVTIENSVNDYPALNFNGYAYTIGVEPQIGPAFEKLDRRNEYRNYMYYAEGKRKNIRTPKEGVETITSRVTWVALTGKYFEVIAVPDATQYAITVDTEPITGLKDRSSLYFGRPEIRSSMNTDVYRLYMGPKKREILARFNDAGKNPYGLSDLHFEESIATSAIIGWLASILKFFLELFYRLIPNYGVAIILLTILIKAILFPLTHKSFESTARMQALQPKVSELREKYKDNPQKMNQEMAALYKKEGVSPLGGCLPLLLQLPIFFALYNLLSTHFELRSAVFIPGWINDLSSPESVWDFSPVAIPFVGWHNLRVLPFVMLVTTFIQSRFTQAPDSSGGANMKMMTYAMPIVFFFILYDMPSGLVLYWTMQNVLTIFQQMYTNSRRKAKAAAEAALPPPRASGKGPPGGKKKPPKRRK